MFRSLVCCWLFTWRNRVESEVSHKSIHQLLESSYASLMEISLTSSCDDYSRCPSPLPLALEDTPLPFAFEDVIKPCGRCSIEMNVQLDCLVIPSFGDSPPADVVTKKGAGAFLGGVMDDLRAIQALVREDRCKQLIGVELMCHFAKVEVSSFLRHVENLMTEKRIQQDSSDDGPKGLLLWYSGHGKMVSGDWCFNDGFVTFEDIYNLYMRYFKGRYLYIVTDCCYSGAWVVECARLLDRDGITCSHAAKREQVYIKVFASCLHNQSAHDKFYTACKGVKSSRGDAKTILFPRHKIIRDGRFYQTTLGMDFTQDCRCVVDQEGACRPYTWTRRVQSLIYEDASREYFV